MPKLPVVELLQAALQNLDTVLSLKDGETSIIGGLIQRSNGNEKNKLILLSDIPLIGDLFTDTNTNNNKNELLLAITPRLVRGVTVPQSSLMSFSSGKEDDPSLVKSLASFTQEPVYDVMPPSGQRSVAIPPGFVMPPVTVQPPVILAPTPVSPIQSIAPSAAVDQALPGMLQISAPSNVSTGQQFGVVINLNNAFDIASAPFLLNYDPAYVQFVSALEGGFFTKAGKTALFSSKPDPKAGTVEISLVKTAGDSGVTGSGDIATVQFRAVNAGAANFSFGNLAFSAADGKPVNILPFSTLVEIK